VHRESSNHLAWRSWSLAGDLLVAWVALYLAFQIRILAALPGSSEPLPAEKLAYFDLLSIWVVLSQPVALYFFGLYETKFKRPRLEIARWVSLAVFFQTLTLATALFLADQAFPRSVLLLFALLNTAFLVLWRAALQSFVRSPLRQVVLIGCGPAAIDVAQKIREHHFHGLEVRGYLPVPGSDPAGGPVPSSDPAGGPVPGSGPAGGPAAGPAAGSAESPDAEVRGAALGPRLASAAELQRMLADGEVDDVILAPEADGWQTALLDEIAGNRSRRPTILLLPGPFESLIGTMRYRWINDLPLIEVMREGDWRAAMPVKRAFDLAGATALAIVAAPILPLVALAVRLSSPGPVLFRQERVGRALRSFEVLKFRTMRADAERDSGEVLAQRDDPRLTPVGGFLRRYRLDELPQLWNVLVGEMSLVGPRPERPGFVQQHLVHVPGYAERFAAPPGLTGLAQVNGEYHSTPENKLRYDLAYISNQSLWLDLSILVRTVRIVLTSQGV
jgi:lipopolysaccharide/colanic/teichoic acid biosynthesis glycosyltransferase